jgi:HlyD family secretion protein
VGKTTFRIFLAAAILGPSALAGYWWYQLEASQATTYTVSTGDLVEGVTISGSVSMTEKAAMAAEVVAAVQEIHVKEGQPVEANDVLLELESGVVVAEYNKALAREDIAEQHLEELEKGARQEEITEAEQTVAQARAEFEYADKDFTNLQKLSQQGGASEQELDLAKRRRSVAQALLKQAQARLTLLKKGVRSEQIETARSKLKLARAETQRMRAIRERYIVRAPHDGHVTAKYVNVGEIVTPGQTLLRVDNLQTVQVRAQAQEAQLGHIERGMEAKVLADAYPDTPFTAVVAGPLQRVEETSGTVTVLLEIKGKPDIELMDGMGVDVALIRNHRTNVVRVPAETVFGKGSEAFVWIRSGGGFEKRNVVTGVTDGQFIEIREGLQAGDVVRVP